MIRIRWLLFLLMVFSTTPRAVPVVLAQTPKTSPTLAMNVHAGASRIQALEGGPLGFFGGARVLLNPQNGFRFGASLDVLPREAWTGFLYGLSAERIFLGDEPIQPFVGFGIGGMVLAARDNIGEEVPRTNLFLPLVAGIDWPGPAGTDWRIRTELRDDVIVRDSPSSSGAIPVSEGASGSDRPRGGVDHNWGFSVGVSWSLGKRPDSRSGPQTSSGLINHSQP